MSSIVTRTRSHAPGPPRHSRARGRAAMLLATAGLVAAVAISGCGSDEEAASTAASGAPKADVAAAKAEFEKALNATTNWKGPGESVDLTKIDKPIWLISCGSGNEFCKNANRGFEAAAKAAGVKYNIYVADPTPPAQTTAIQTAVARGAGVIALISVDPKNVEGPLAAARAKGIKIVDVLNSEPGEANPGTDAPLTFSFIELGKTTAQFAIMKLGDKLNAYCANTPTYPTVAAYCEGFTDEVKRLCPSCKTSGGNYVVTSLARDVPAGIQAALRRDPDINWITCGIDGLCTFIVATIKSMGLKDKVFAGAQTAVLVPNLQFVQKGDVQILDMGAPSSWTGWAVFDQAARLAAGQEPTTEPLPVKVFTTDTLSAREGLEITADSENEVFETDGGRLYQDVYLKVWGKQ